MFKKLIGEISEMKNYEIRKSIEENKRVKETSRLTERIQVGYSKKKRRYEYVPYNFKDHNLIGSPVARPSLGAWKIGENEWKDRAQRLQRVMSHSKSLKKYNRSIMN